MTHELRELVAQYRSTAAAWDAARNDAKKANPLFDRLHQQFKELRASQLGREAIAALMDDDNIGVRLMAATHSLAWLPDKASSVLSEIEKVPGLYAVTAKYTLKSFREGRLHLDW